MALRFGLSGGNFAFAFTGTNTNIPGIWASGGGNAGYNSSASAPAGAGDLYAYFGTNASTLLTPNLGGNYSALIAGYRVYIPTLNNNQPFIQFYDNSANLQCDVRMNGTGQLFFTRNSTVIGSTSTLALTTNTWTYIEFKAIFSTGGAGTCEVRVNGVSWAISTGLTNATTTSLAAATRYAAPANSYLKDFYALDTGSGANTTYLGDIKVFEVYPNGPGVNSAWTSNVGPFTLTSVNGAGVYQGTITGGTANAYVGYNFNITGFVNGANNLVGGICTASSISSITFGGNVTVVESATGSAAFQAIVQEGINQTGTRPNGDVTYVFSNTASQIIDYAHSALSVSGVILGVIHQSYMRKDDAGTRQVQQVCISSGTTENSASISLGNTYQYWQDILEVDPNTSSQWALSAFNSSTWGVKEIT